MAMIACSECAVQISTKAAACPKCGAKPPKKTSLFTWIIGGITLVVVYQCTSQTSGREDRPQTKSAAEIRADAELNSGIAAGNVIKNSMKDPASFKMESFVIFPGGSACMTYRGKNSFAAVVPGSAVYDGKTILTSDRDGNKFVKMWNEICAKGGGAERAAGLNVLGVW